MSDESTPRSFGELFSRVEETKAQLENVSRKTSEYYERSLAGAGVELTEVIDDLLVILREHLSCHDCNIPEHVHWREYDSEPGDTTAGIVPEKEEK